MLQVDKSKVNWLSVNSCIVIFLLWSTSLYPPDIICTFSYNIISEGELSDLCPLSKLVNLLNIIQTLVVLQLLHSDGLNILVASTEFLYL